MDIGAVVNWIKDHWLAIGVVYLALHKILVTIRDIIDKNPDKDTNLFEKVVTLMGKLAKYFATGERPK